MIVDPKHRLGAWLGKKSAKTLFESLAKANELETMIKIANVSLARGLAVHTKESIGSLMTAVSLAGTAEQQAAVLSIAEKSVTAEDLAALKVQFAAPAAAEEASVEEEAK